MRGEGLLFVRLAIGIGQGTAFWVLYRLGRDGDPTSWSQSMIVTLAVVALYMPVSISAALATMRRRPLLIWSLGMSLALFLLTQHHLSQFEFEIDGYEANPMRAIWRSGFIVFTLALMFVCQSLAFAAEVDRSPIARYATYFEVAWKNAFQLLCSLAFAGFFYLTILLGLKMLALIGWNGIDDVINSWALPSYTLTLGLAIATHLTDVKPSLIAGVPELQQ